MGFTTSNALILLLLLSSCFLINLGLGIAMAIRYKSNRSLPTLLASIIFCMEVFGICVIMLDALFKKSFTDGFELLLKPYHMLCSFLLLLPLCAYEIELKVPGWCKIRKCILAVLPPVLAAIAATMFSGNFTEIRSISEIPGVASNPDVILRLLLAVMLIVYSVVATMIPSNWRECLISRTALVIFDFMLVLASIAFVLGLNMGIYPAAIVNFIIIGAINVYLAVIELKIRIVRDEQPQPVSSPAVPDNQIFDNPDIWMNPDMTAPQLAKLLGTNRTYLAEQIRAQGYSSYNDMVNRRRIAYICDKLRDSKDARGITQLMFDAGYRSRSNANSEFKKITGKTPTEYIKSLK